MSRAEAAGRWSWLLLCVVFAGFLRDARGEGVAQVMTSKSLPEATVEVIDPESGTSSGSSGADVKLAPGDIILFRFAMAPVPDKTSRGIQAYLTEYVPANTEVVGVRLIDADGYTIEPRYPGIALDGCHGGSSCNGFASVPCNGGSCDLEDGSIAQVYADTGVFYSTSPLLARQPAGEFISMDNGVPMVPEPRTISPGIVSLLNDTTGPYYAHNAWDWIQVQAYGFAGAASDNSGTGNTPYLYGSAVAGPGAFYPYQATEVSAGVIEFNDDPGPWQRVYYPGSLVGTGSSVDSMTGNNEGLARKVVVVDPASAFDVTPATPIQNATAVRLAVGAVRTGKPAYAELALRVLAVPIDPEFDTPNGGNVDCGEVFGSDVAARGLTSGGRDNPWPTYIASPACVYLKLLFDVDADKDLAVTGEVVTYTVSGKNLSVDTDTGAVARLMFDSSKQSYLAGSAVPAPTSGPSTCTDDSTLQCVSWSLGALAPSDEYTITAQFSVGGGGHTSNVMAANYQSASLPAPGFTNRALTISTGIAMPTATLALGFDPTVTAPDAGETAALVGTLSNEGNNAVTIGELVIPLPAGWSVAGAVSLGGATLACTADCGSDRPTYSVATGFTAGQSRGLTFSVNVPAATPTGLYDIDLQLWATQSAFGGDFETYFAKLASVPVNQVRSEQPVITCPVGSTSTAVSGTTSEGDGTTVRLYFNLIERGSGSSAGTDWTVGTFGPGTPFGELYGGLEVRATAQAPGERESELSLPCYVSPSLACSDELDNDGDGLVDFPADPGCESPTDKDEQDPVLECSDLVDNDGDSSTDYPNDLGCYGPEDPLEGDPACGDGVDNDGDGLVDFPGDPGCSGASDPNELEFAACQDGVDNDGDLLVDYPADPGCHGSFDGAEADVSFPVTEIRARVLILFDTSGSMNLVTGSTEFGGGDGSLECPGSGGSRLAAVKRGITNVVTGFGEVEYSLMRFFQRPTEFACPEQSAGLRSGGWQGGGLAPCGGGFDSGELLVSFAPDNQYTLLQWLDGESGYLGTPPPGMDMELRGSGTTPIAGSLSSALSYLTSVRASDPQVSCRPYRVVLVTDGLETCGGDPEASAAALAAAGIPVHVIGFADATLKPTLDLIAAAGGTTESVVASDSSTLSMEISAIVTETILVEVCNDEDDDCDTEIDEDFFALGNSCSNGELGVCERDGVHVCSGDGLGTVCNALPGTPLCPPADPECECNGLDDDCDGLIDEGFPASCICIPIPEVCNGLDDDCDGAADNAPSGGALPGVGDTCGFDVGECSYGTLACVDGGLECQGGVGPVTETCDGLDNDCDAQVDELVELCFELGTGAECDLTSGLCFGQCRAGIRQCAPGGGPGECDGDFGPMAELCNGLDDDCDGSVDEDFNAGAACDNGMSGACLVTGTVECTADGLGTVCTAFPVTPGIESCNGIDDDCDGDIDEAPLPPPIGNSCGEGTGCTGGTLSCVDGAIACVGGTGGTAETCNGLDDDCDLLIDEAPLPGEGEDCYSYETGCEVGVGCVGECQFGATLCVAAGFQCVDDVGPRPETCNGVDDNCDGTVDNEAHCPSGDDLCHQGACIFECKGGEFPCPLNFLCRDVPGLGAYCVPNPCVDVACPTGELCDTVDGSCYDPCDIITCPEGSTCDAGTCYDCFDPGFECDDGEVCEVDALGVGICQVELCFGVECGAEGFCRDGVCVPLVCSPSCGDGEQCIEGVCSEDLCAEIFCAQDKVCNEGTCVEDLCGGQSCQAGFACDPATGDCVRDPCSQVVCPAGTECVLDFQTEPSCLAPPPQPPPENNDIRVYAAGDGCNIGSGRAAYRGAWWLLGVMIALVHRRRRIASNGRTAHNERR